jgi:hypothetical protein
MTMNESQGGMEWSLTLRWNKLFKKLIITKKFHLLPSWFSLYRRCPLFLVLCSQYDKEVICNIPSVISLLLSEGLNLFFKFEIAFHFPCQLSFQFGQSLLSWLCSSLANLTDWGHVVYWHSWFSLWCLDTDLADLFKLLVCLFL